MPLRAWLDVLKRTRLAMKADQVPLLAAGTAFFGLLALIPGLVAMVSIYGLVSDPADVQRQINSFSSALPDSARQLLTEQLQTIVDSSSRSLGLAAIIGVAAALWSASSGIGHLVDSLNVAYDEGESRGPVKLKAQALLLTIGGVVFLVVAVGLIAVLPAVTDRIGMGDAGATALNLLRWPLLIVAFMTALSVLYRVSPDRRAAQWRWVSWGAGFATIIWVLVSALFSLYVENFGSFNETYGTLAGVIVLMMWLYLSATVVLFGAELNSELERQTAADTTVGEPAPIGQRGAVAADTIAPDSQGRAAGPATASAGAARTP
ncbi:YihY/virulence factor BrkB family protein [soil metagenome]